tara:strand:+ start:352 stop:504 length:153 start_codon:yes stop_codon:yes gene_type:complete
MARRLGSGRGKVEILVLMKFDDGTHGARTLILPEEDAELFEVALEGKGAL